VRSERIIISSSIIINHHLSSPSSIIYHLQGPSIINAHPINISPSSPSPPAFQGRPTSATRWIPALSTPSVQLINSRRSTAHCPSFLPTFPPTTLPSHIRRGRLLVYQPQLNLFIPLLSTMTASPRKLKIDVTVSLRVKTRRRRRRVRLRPRVPVVEEPTCDTRELYSKKQPN
jgi:hypothetical protein